MRRQNLVGDCSVVASLAVAAHFEFKHNYTRKLVTNKIFPQVKYKDIIRRMKLETLSITQMENT